MKMKRPEKIISGGQTGADQGALIGASICGIKTGGWMTRGFMTEDGPWKHYAVFNMQAHASSHYPDRTEANVIDSDATIWVGQSDNSRGFICTTNATRRHKRPFLNNPDAALLRQFVSDHGVKVLNVAGPRGSHDGSAFIQTATLIVEAFFPT